MNSQLTNRLWIKCDRPSGDPNQRWTCWLCLHIEPQLVSRCSEGKVTAFKTPSESSEVHWIWILLNQVQDVTLIPASSNFSDARSCAISNSNQADSSKKLQKSFFSPHSVSDQMMKSSFSYFFLICLEEIAVLRVMWLYVTCLCWRSESSLPLLIMVHYIRSSNQQYEQSKVSKQEPLYVKRFCCYFLLNLVQKAFKQPWSSSRTFPQLSPICRLHSEDLCTRMHTQSEPARSARCLFFATWRKRWC